MEKKSGKLDIENVVSTILADYKEDRIINKTDVSDQPDRDAVNEINSIILTAVLRFLPRILFIISKSRLPYLSYKSPNIPVQHTLKGRRLRRNLQESSCSVSLI